MWSGILAYEKLGVANDVIWFYRRWGKYKFTFLGKEMVSRDAGEVLRCKAVGKEA
jgi:hypothetical protein